jgi:hypothetical protein
VVCAYQFGSRVWQTADATSGRPPHSLEAICQFCIELMTRTIMRTDWDYRLVIDGWQGPEHLDDRCPFIDAWY